MMEHIKLLSDQRRNDLRIWGDKDRMNVDYFNMSMESRDHYDLMYLDSRKSVEDMKKLPKQGSLGSSCGKRNNGNGKRL